MTENKKTMDLRKQLFAALAMMIVAALALGTSTYAWFVNNTSVQATGMTVNATADDSIVIMGTQDDGSTDSVFTSVGTNNLSYTSLKPATSYDGQNFATISKDVKVQSSGASAATWNGTDGALGDGDLVTATENTNYVISDYKIMSKNKDADIYVSGIDVTYKSDKESKVLSQSLRVSVKIGTSCYVFAPVSGAANSSEGVGKLVSEKWSLVSKTYDSVNEPSKKFSLAADTEEACAVAIWFEGQDKSCYSNAVSTNDASITVHFAKVE